MLALKILFGLLGAIFLGYGFALLEKAYELLRLRKLYLSTPLMRIAQTGEKILKVRGHVEQCRETMVGPFSGKPCLYYKFQVMKRKPNGGLRRVRRESREAPFCIRDISGLATVLPQKSRFIVSHDSYRGEELSGQGKENLMKMLSLKEEEELKNYQVMEEHLEPDEEVTIMGFATNGEKELSIGSRNRLPLLVVRCSDAAFVLLYSRAFFRLLLTALCFLVSAVIDFQLLCGLSGK